ncbi:hypothetical protein [Thermomonospora catenispora]|uniref:divisome protein SepX/GlpR n=1 Tax=Thermomonospora catenispora TaxID=2493090 RepID=UPI001124C9FB|nr:hypothetical protein [Thermomonospora catenispora]TNY37288.1 hypothetical protein EIO00_09125 [Thermomonospora catenispora]
MSSTLLYLAIVAVWAVVLVPMWLRRDASRALARHPDLADELVMDELEEAEETGAEGHETAEDFTEPRPAPPRRRRRSSRAAVIARRRRRTFGLTLLLLGSTVLVALRQAPWWTALPAAFLFLAHLALLRAAARIDASRRRERARARAAAAARRAAEETAPRAEVIELPPTAGRVVREVFDQYADDRRAVGD